MALRTLISLKTRRSTLLKIQELFKYSIEEINSPSSHETEINDIKIDTGYENTSFVNRVQWGKISKKKHYT